MREERFRVVSVLDPAIDTAAMLVKQMIEYQEKRYYPLIQRFFKPGEKPTVFHVREIPRALWSHVQAAGDKSEVWKRAFRCGVEKVEDVYNKDGVTTPEWKPVGVRLADKTVMTDEECDEHFAPHEWEEIGAVIHTHSFLHRRIAVRYPLLSSCLELLGQRPYRPAEASQSTVTETTNADPSAETSPAQTANA